MDIQSVSDPGIGIAISLDISSVSCFVFDRRKSPGRLSGPIGYSLSEESFGAFGRFFYAADGSKAFGNRSTILFFGIGLGCPWEPSWAGYTGCEVGSYGRLPIVGSSPEHLNGEGRILGVRMIGCDRMGRFSDTRPPQIIPAQWQHASDQGGQKIADLRKHSAPGPDVDRIKSGADLSGPVGIHFRCKMGIFFRMR